MDFKNVQRLRHKLKKEGRSLVWFHKNYIGKKMTCGAMYQQLNKGYEVCEMVNKSIEKYLILIKQLTGA